MLRIASAPASGARNSETAVAPATPKLAEHASAKELQHMSPAWAQRGRQRLEDVVEHFNKDRPRCRVG